MTKRIVASIAVGLMLVSVAAAASDRPNVLFIAVDDLRPDLGCYGDKDVKSPNIDKLSAGGTTFMSAYCQQAVCSPTRTSLLCGRRPDTTKVWDLNTHFRKNIPDVVTLPEYFKKNGYHTQGLSKIYHAGLDDPQSWSVPHWAPPGKGYVSAEFNEAVKQRRAKLRKQQKPIGKEVTERDPKTGLVLKTTENRNQVKGPPWEAADVADNGLPDGMTADKAIEVLHEIKDKPFFLAVGFLKPHLPFIAPKKYYDMYPLDEIKPASNPFAPKDMPEIAGTNWGELRGYIGMPKNGPVSDQQARELIRGYRAATSYTDAQIGRVLDELDKLGLAKNTIVVLWGDHGWHLGEHGMWCKHTDFEVATHTMLVLRDPRQGNGKKTNALVEFVDIYPTLCELCGLSLPDGLEGTSMAPLLKNPERSWKKAAFSEYPRPKDVMGYSMRTERYRYTEWLDGAGPQSRMKKDIPPGPPADCKVIGVELYDHQADPAENVNLAERPDMKDTVAELSKALHAGWKAALPDK